MNEDRLERLEKRVRHQRYFLAVQLLAICGLALAPSALAKGKAKPAAPSIAHFDQLTIGEEGGQYLVQISSDGITISARDGESLAWLRAEEWSMGGRTPGDKPVRLINSNVGSMAIFDNRKTTVSIGASGFFQGINMTTSAFLGAARNQTMQLGYGDSDGSAPAMRFRLQIGDGPTKKSLVVIGPEPEARLRP